MALGRECKGVCRTMPNAHSRIRWRENGRRYCSLCDKAFDVPPDTDSYPCECCTGLTRGEPRHK